jgi:CubicO group peptidase (beta-lactamase class C family)
MPFDRLIRQELYVPCGMGDCFNGMTDEELQEYTSRIPAAAARTKPDLHWANPAGGTLGPTWQLGRFYEMILLGKGTLNGRQILQPQTVADMTSLQAGQGLWHWGLGFNLNYAWGRYGSEASTKTFGHNGASGMIAFADPQVGIVIAMIGLRMTFIDRIYRDLGL